jgi:predicted glycosyltransferase
MNALFAREAKRNSQAGQIVLFETVLVSLKTRGYTAVLTCTERGVGHGSYS